MKVLKKPVYFDNAATTRMDDRVLEAMLPYMKEAYGNASGKYSKGFEARKAVNSAREKVAALIGAYPDEIYFTSGATESNNIVIKNTEGALLSSEAEHPSVLNSALFCRKQGRTVDLFRPDHLGRITPKAVSEAFDNTAAGRSKKGLLSVMYVNNELGTVSPVTELAEAAHEHGFLFHTDIVQAIGHTEIDVRTLNADMMSASAHKLYGPKGIGFLYIKRGIKLPGLFSGGLQERGFRPGTENVPGIVGFGKACELAGAEMTDNAQREKETGSFIKEYILSNIQGSYQNGEGDRILNFSFDDVSGESVVLRLDIEGICVSTGSACSLGREDASHVLKAIGLDMPAAKGSLRISIGKYNAMDEAEQLVTALKSIVEELRALTIY